MRRPSSFIETVNLESGMPTVDTALRRLDSAIADARVRCIRALRIIHGYGSTGVGGKIRTAVRAKLAQYKASGRIRSYIAGEDFSPFYDESRKFCEELPQLKTDRDYLRGNDGITIVIL